MKISNVLVLLALLISEPVFSQFTNQAIRANFGVEADLRANFYNSFVQAGNDDWFSNNPGPGSFVIDTTGAAYLLQQYNSKPSSRMLPFFRGMRQPQFTVMNGKLLVDAVMIRDHHGDDSTVFASGSNKNAMHPGSWTTPTSQGVPDKNDILDMFMHVRYDGASVNDSLWLFGGVSLDAVTGNRYFDFEMYQTDITYNRAGLNFVGFGPDEGHTSWKFDALGNLQSAGDVIFTAEYSSSSLSAIEARIWVHKSALLIAPTAFSWGGKFDGASASSNYGYANILPLASGDFYTGTQSGNNTWAGPFGLVSQDNVVGVNYSARQFMEFSVNLSKLGLDYVVKMNDPCAMPFRRILVKSRSSTSFNAELKDFVGPFDFFRAPRANASANIPFFCGTSGHSIISVENPLPTSLYTWNTPDGHILGADVGPTISVDRAGTYIVNQQLMDSCGVSYARDTVVVYQDLTCVLLPIKQLEFKSAYKKSAIELQWRIDQPASVKYFELERKNEHGKYISIARIQPSSADFKSYSFTDDEFSNYTDFVNYRLRIIDRNGNEAISKTLAHRIQVEQNALDLTWNFSGNQVEFLLSSGKTGRATISVRDVSGRLHHTIATHVQQGNSKYILEHSSHLKPGIYIVTIQINNQRISKKMMITR